MRDTASWETKWCYLVFFPTEGLFLLTVNTLHFAMLKVKLELSLPGNQQGWMLCTQSLFPLPPSSSAQKCSEDRILYPHRARSFKWTWSSNSPQGIVLISRISICHYLFVLQGNSFRLKSNCFKLSWYFYWCPSSRPSLLSTIVFQTSWSKGKDYHCQCALSRNKMFKTYFMLFIFKHW